MAKAQKDSKSKEKLKKTKPTMRDLASGDTAKKTRRVKAGKKFTSPFKRAARAKLPDNKFGRLLSKRGRIVPGFFRGAWNEIRQTIWPNRKETIRLTIAVFIFSTIFAVIIAFLDFILDKIFKNLIIK